MKVGDLVRHSFHFRGDDVLGVRVGLVIELTEKKCWRTDRQGHKISWGQIEPEAHAVVLYPNQDAITVPAIELEVVNNEKW